MALDKIAICNEALADVPADAIADFSEDSQEAEWCARRYSPALAYLLELHNWKFPVHREALAEVTNDRDAEWAYAYAVPINVAAELRVLPSYTSAAASVPLLAGQVLAPTMAFYHPAQIHSYSYLLAGSTLYTNVQEAILEYIRDDPSEAVFPALFTRALSLELASRLVMPLKKDRVRQGDLIKMAELARDRAIADSRNRDPSESHYGIFMNESELAREGVGIGYAGFGWWETR
jgi:hypothetical protein